MQVLQRLRFDRDAKILIASVGIASLSGGFAGVVQAIYLDMIGISPVLIGVVASVSIVASALRMVVFGVLADKVGRKKVLVLIFATSIIYDLIYFSAKDYVFFLLAAIIGGAGGEGYGGYVEGSLLSEKVGDSRRNAAFSIQYFVGSSLSAVGSFASGLPDFISGSLGVPLLDAIRLVFALQAFLVAIAAVSVLLITENTRTISDRNERYLSPESRMKIAKLSFTGIFDGFGVGMFINLASLWFYLRFGMDIKSVGYVFALSKIAESVAYLGGPMIAERRGLVWTFSMARFAGGVAAVVLAFMPTYQLAAVVYTARNATQHIGTSLRTSYTMSIFNRRERASAASLSNLASTGGNTVATSISGYMMQNISTTLPPLISGALVGVAAKLYYLLFRNIKPPEESQHR